MYRAFVFFFFVFSADAMALVSPSPLRVLAPEAGETGGKRRDGAGKRAWFGGRMALYHNYLFLVASLLLVAMLFVPSSFLFLVVRGSYTSSDAVCS